jgi:MoaA/NifB/PqqE/SkfB family radical SAM enzyme
VDSSLPVVPERRPGTLMVHLLGRCNLTCAHCYMEGSPARREELPIESVLDAIEQSPRVDIGTLYVTGGEPFLYRHLTRVLEAAAAVPGLETTLCTNATCVRDHDAAALAALRVKVNVSIDGPAELHDEMRGERGAFAAAERGIAALVRCGLRVTVITTLAQRSLGALPALADWCRSVGVVELRVQPLLKLGRGLAIADQCLTTPQLNTMLLQLSDLANQHRGTGLRCSLVGVTRRFLLEHPCGAYVCNGGGCHRRVAKELKKIVIREDGTVLPEITNLDSRFAIGRLGVEPLYDLVRAYFERGYDAFDQLCRESYADVLPRWEAPVVPWDQIVAERSRHWRPGARASATPSCGTECGRAEGGCALPMAS